MAMLQKQQTSDTTRRSRSLTNLYPGARHVRSTELPSTLRDHVVPDDEVRRGGGRVHVERPLVQPDAELPHHALVLRMPKQDPPAASLEGVLGRKLNVYSNPPKDDADTPKPSAGFASRCNAFVQNARGAS